MLSVPIGNMPAVRVADMSEEDLSDIYIFSRLPDRIGDDAISRRTDVIAGLSGSPCA